MRVSSWCWVGAGLCAAALLTTPVDAQRGPRSGGGGAGGVCDPRTSEHVDLKTIAADPARWLGHCVTVPGVYASERVYADLDAIYGDNPNAIGGYVDGHGATEGFWQGEFTGRIADCKAAAANIDAGLLKSPGILIDNSRQAGCVKPEGQFLLFMSQGDLQPARLARRLPGKATGDLTPAPKDWSDTALAKRLSDFLAALRTKNTPALTTLVGDAYAAEQLYADNTAIADLRKPGDHPLQVFLDRTSNTPAAACWCRTADCAKTWPIALRDTDNQITRPYACVRIYTNEGTTLLDASRNSEGVPEGR